MITVFVPFYLQRFACETICPYHTFKRKLDAWENVKRDVQLIYPAYIPGIPRTDFTDMSSIYFRCMFTYERSPREESDWGRFHEWTSCFERVTPLRGSLCFICHRRTPNRVSSRLFGFPREGRFSTIQSARPIEFDNWVIRYSAQRFFLSFSALPRALLRALAESEGAADYRGRDPRELNARTDGGMWEITRGY